MMRILLEPAANPFGGGGGVPAPSAPAPVQSSPVSAPVSVHEPSANSPERGSVSSPSTNSGERNYEVDLPGQGGGQPSQGQPPQQRQALPTPTDPNQAAGAGVPSNFQSIRDAAREYGFNFSGDIQDDRAALQHLIHRAQGNEYYAQMGQRLAPHAAGIQSYLQQRNQPATQAQPERPSWEAPPFDQRWSALVVRDEQTGMFLSKPGVDPSIGRSVNEYVDWKQKYDENPSGVLNAMVQARAREEAISVYREQNAAQQQQNAATAIFNKNASWFYQRGADGQPVRDFQGRPVPSPAGAGYLRHLETVQSYGVTDPRAQDHLVMQLLRGEYASQNIQRTQQQATANGFPAQQASQQVNTNPLQTLPPSQRAITQGATQPGEEGLSLYERMSREFASNGVTDADFSPERMGFTN
jgi:hypothetical protein